METCISLIVRLRSRCCVWLRMFQVHLGTPSSHLGLMNGSPSSVVVALLFYLMCRASGSAQPWTPLETNGIAWLRTRLSARVTLPESFSTTRLNFGSSKWRRRRFLPLGHERVAAPRQRYAEDHIASET